MTDTCKQSTQIKCYFHFLFNFHSCFLRATTLDNVYAPKTFYDDSSKYDTAENTQQLKFLNDNNGEKRIDSNRKRRDPNILWDPVNNPY